MTNARWTLSRERIGEAIGHIIGSVLIAFIVTGLSSPLIIAMHAMFNCFCGCK